MLTPDCVRLPSAKRCRASMGHDGTYKHRVRSFVGSTCQPRLFAGQHGPAISDASPSVANRCHVSGHGEKSIAREGLSKRHCHRARSHPPVQLDIEPIASTFLTHMSLDFMLPAVNSGFSRLHAHLWRELLELPVCYRYRYVRVRYAYRFAYVSFIVSGGSPAAWP